MNIQSSEIGKKVIFKQNENDKMNTKMARHNGEIVQITSNPVFHSDYFGYHVWVENAFCGCYVAFLSELNPVQS